MKTELVQVRVTEEFKRDLDKLVSDMSFYAGKPFSRGAVIRYAIKKLQEDYGKSEA